MSIVTKESVLEIMPENPLISAVFSQLVADDKIQTCIDAAEHGGDSGFGGFTYTTDCIEFVKTYQPQIRETLLQLADEQGEDMLEMVSDFQCLNGAKISLTQIASVLFSDGADAGEAADTIYNALAWFALEHVGNLIVDMRNL